MNVVRLFKYEIGFATKKGIRHFGLKSKLDVEKHITRYGIKNMLFIKEFH